MGAKTSPWRPHVKGLLRLPSTGKQSTFSTRSTKTSNFAAGPTAWSSLPGAVYSWSIMTGRFEFEFRRCTKETSRAFAVIMIWTRLMIFKNPTGRLSHAQGTTDMLWPLVNWPVPALGCSGPETAGLVQMTSTSPAIKGSCLNTINILSNKVASL